MMRFSLLFPTAGLLLATATTAGSMGGVDVGVTSLEVTQAVQTTANTVRLVAQRGTAVRTTLSVTGTGSPVGGVTGRLHVFVNGIEITPAAGVAAINEPFTAPVAPSRSDEDDTLNFELEAPTGITPSSNVDFQVDITVAGDSNPANDTGTLDNQTFLNRVTPLLFFTRINYTPSGLGAPSLSSVQAGTGDAFVKGILPVNDGDPELYQEGPFPTLSFSVDTDGDGIVDALSTDGDDLLSLLEACRQLIVDSGVGASDRIFLNGWVNGQVQCNGLAELPGRVSFSNTQEVRGQRSYAHELTHNLGEVHNSDTTGEIGWDVGGRLIDNPAGNNTTTRIKPATLFDIMNPGKLTNQAWVEISTYDALLDHETFQPALPDFSRFILVVRGIFDPEGQQLIRLKPVFRYPWLSEPTMIPRKQETFNFEVRIPTAAGVLTTPFNAIVADDGEGEQERFGAFEVMIPFVGDPASLQIGDFGGKMVLGGFQRSQARPRLRITSPPRGLRLPGRARVEFLVRDPDTPRDQLMFQAAFSPDSGGSFVPIAVDLRRNRFFFDARRVPRAKGTGLIRIFASDGLNTAFADVGGLSTPPPRARR